MSKEIDSVDRKKFDKRGEFQDLLNPIQLESIKNAFHSQDITNTNELDIDKLKEVLIYYGIDPNSDESLEKIFDEAENNGRVSIDFDRLIDIITLKLSNIDSMDELEKVFSLFLGNENTDKIEFKHLRNYCPGLTDEEIEEMIQKADKDKDHKINFEEFHNIITKRI